MSWRTIVISSRCKLDTKMGYMVIRGEETKRVFLDEIAILLIENPAVSLTGCLLEALIERKVRVIFCNAQRSPTAELAPYHGSHDCSRKLRMQLSWAEHTKGVIWGAIIAEKIAKQAALLAEQNKQREAMLLESYIDQIEFQDASNREGHAAKVYFNALFGMDFSRHAKDPVNAALDYGYSLLLSAFNREITTCGYLTQLGLHHDNVFNCYNLSSDIMEPFRMLIDRRVLSLEFKELDKDVRLSLINVLNDEVTICGSRQTVANAVRIYTKSVFDALNEDDPSLIRFYRL